MIKKMVARFLIPLLGFVCVCPTLAYDVSYEDEIEEIKINASYLSDSLLRDEIIKDISCLEKRKDKCDNEMLLFVLLLRFQILLQRQVDDYYIHDDYLLGKIYRNYKAIYTDIEMCNRVRRLER